MYRKRTHRTKILVATLAALLTIGAGAAYWHFAIADDNPPARKERSGVNYDPPTKEEKQAGEEQKDENAKDQDPSQTPPSNSDGKRTVSVVISGAEQYEGAVEVRAFVPEYLQDGTCTITLTKDAHRVTKTTPAYADASSTICTNPEIKRAEFPVAGEWSLTVTYDSAGAHGTSAAQKVTIQ